MSKMKHESYECYPTIVMDEKNYSFEGEDVIFPGKCSVCGRKFIQIFRYVETRNAKTNEVLHTRTN